MESKNSREPVISQEEYDELEKMISSDQSVVGIDAKKTHIIILYKLQQIEQRLDSLEQRLK